MMDDENKWTLPPELTAKIFGRRPSEARSPPIDDIPPPTSPDDYGPQPPVPKNGKANGHAPVTPRKPPRADWRENAVSADRLQGMTFNPVTFVLPTLIPAEGLTLICSKPKVGKSWLVLDLAIGATTDRFVLGQLKPKQGDVLYLALEDSRRRLQSRLTKLLPTFTGAWPPGLTLATQWARVDQGGLDDIRAWVKQARDAARTISFVAIDVLKIVRQPLKNGQTPYDADYEAIRILQQLAFELNVPIVVVHHTRKAEAEDLMDKVSGTYGVVGAADTILVVDRQSQGLVFDVRGRDVEANTFAAEFSKETCRWTMLGDASELHQSKERQRILAVFADATEPLGPQDVTALVTCDFGSAGQSQTSVRQLLSKMARDGMLIRVGRGKYSISKNISSHNVTNDDADDLSI